MNIEKLCDAVILANKLHEESYVAKTPQSYGRYTRSWDECVDAAAVEHLSELNSEWQPIIYFLAITGEGVDICLSIKDKL